MNNVVTLHNSDERQEQASLWVSRLDRELTREETTELKAWLAEDPRNRQMLSEMASLWDDMDELSRLAALFPEPETDIVPARTGRSAWAAGLAAAAVLLLAVLVIPVMNDSTPTGDGNVHMASHHTAVGELTAIGLPDGSDLTLNTNSRVEVEFSAQHRLLKLERGELHVQVAEDPDRPLSVLVGDRVVQAVGTAFSVRVDDYDDIELLVTEGRVRVGSRPANSNSTGLFNLPDTALSVTSGQRFLLGQSSERVENLDIESLENEMSWREGRLVFRGETLGEATLEISRYSGVDFVIADKELEQIRIAGLFKTGDVTGFLSTLRANFDIDSEQLDEQTIELVSSAGEPD